MTVRSTPSLSRSTTSVSRAPTIWNSTCISVQLPTSLPSIETTVSPLRMPAFSAGPPSMVEAISAGSSPKWTDGIAERRNASTTARTMFMPGPATATAISFHGEIFSVLSAAEESPFDSLPSIALVPSGSTSGMETYPPSGIQLIRYSTPFQVFFQIAGPNPIEKRSTLSPSLSATIKCPNS